MRLTPQDFSTAVEMTRWGAFGKDDKAGEYVPYSFAALKDDGTDRPMGSFGCVALRSG
jgi:hypothetical protein